MVVQVASLNTLIQQYGYRLHIKGGKKKRKKEKKFPYCKFKEPTTPVLGSL